MPAISKMLSAQMAEIQEQYLQGMFDETVYTDRIRLLNANAKPEAWQRYQDALTYTEYMRARGFYMTDAAFEFARLTAWEQYLDAPLEAPLD